MQLVLTLLGILILLILLKVIITKTILYQIAVKIKPLYLMNNTI
jgi:hypothetical protein